MARAHDKTGPKAIAKRERMDKALQLRARGKKYREIAAELGIGQTTAYNYVSDSVKEIPRESAELVFNIELDRLDDQLAAVWPDVLAGDTKAAEIALKIHDKRMKLFHLDKVHNNDNTGEARAMFQAFIDAMRGEPATPEPDEDNDE